MWFNTVMYGTVCRSGLWGGLTRNIFFKNICLQDFLYFLLFCGSALVSTRIRIQLFISMQIRIGIWSDLWKSQKIEFFSFRRYRVQKYFWKAGNQVYLFILVNFNANGSGSAFPTRIRDSQFNADPDPLSVFKLASLMRSRHFGSVAAATIRNFEMEKLPLVILIAKLRGNLEIFQVQDFQFCWNVFIPSRDIFFCYEYYFFSR